MVDRVEVVGLGSCVVDYFALTPRIIGAEEKVIVRDMEVHPGGVTANNLVQAARMGLKTGWFGYTGDDENGQLLLRSFREEGMDTSRVMVKKGERGSFAWIPVDDRGQRSIYMFPNVTAAIGPEDIERDFADYIRGADHFHTEASQLPLPPVITAATIAIDGGTRVFFDLDIDPDYLIQEALLGSEAELMAVLSLSDVLKPCKSAARQLTGLSDPEAMARKLLDYGPGIVALTAGEEGCCIATPEEVVHSPAFSVDVVDTTGAGDAFMGGLSFAVKQGWELERVAAFANACAAYCCTRVGARAMGGREEVDKILAGL